MSSILNALKKLESEAPPRNGDAAPSLHRAMSVRRTLHNRFQKARLIRGLLLALTGVLVLAVGLGLYVNRRQLPIIKGFYPVGEVARNVAPPPQPASDAVNQPRPEPERLASVSEAPARERSVQPAPAPRKPPAPPQKRPVRRPVRAAAPERITPAPAPPAAEPDVPRPRPSAEPATVPTPQSAPRPPAAAKAPAPPASSPPSSPERTPAAGVEMADLAVRTAPPVEPAAPPEPAPAPTPPEEPNQTAAAAGVPAHLANVARRSDPRFHIQALVWSPAPEGRMAMVNGDIVKTGGLVDDARIIHIGETFLIFQENGNRWRHPFRVK